MATEGRGGAVEVSPEDDSDAGTSETAGEPRESDAGTQELSIDEDDIGDLPGTKRQSDEDLEIGEVFELLKNERRRRVITYLKEQDDGVARLNDLAEHIAALENEIDVAQLSSSQRKRVYIGLYQCHLPKMHDFGVVEFQKNRGIITLRDTTQLDPYLLDDDAASTDDRDEPEVDSTPETSERGLFDPTGRTELVAASAVVAVVAVGSIGVGPLAVIPATVWTGISLLAVLWFALN